MRRKSRASVPLSVLYLNAIVGSGEEPGESSSGADDCAEPRRILACRYFVLSAGGGTQLSMTFIIRKIEGIYYCTVYLIRDQICV